MPLRVVVLAHRSLFASGIASQLREHPGPVRVQTIEAGAPNAVEQLHGAHPSIVVVDATDAGAAEKMSMVQLLEAVPRAKVVLIDPGGAHVRVFSVQDCRAQGIRELIALMQELSAA